MHKTSLYQPKRFSPCITIAENPLTNGYSDNSFSLFLLKYIFMVINFLLAQDKLSPTY